MSVASFSSARPEIPATLPFGFADLGLRPAGAARDLALFDAVHAGPDRAERVSALLAAAYRAPGPDADFRRLASMDRHAAILRLALDIGQWPAWFVCRCVHCGKPIDVRVRPDEFRSEPADTSPSGDGSVTVAGPRGETAAYAIPNGHHEAIAAAAPDPARTLALACRLDAATPPDEADAWAEAFDAALAALSPRMDSALGFPCPHCAADTEYWFDPLAWIGRHVAGALRDVHALASAYGWSEADILALSPARRRAYLELAGAAS